MKIILLMAGKATRFIDSKYKEYKPLIKVGSNTIVDWTLKSLGDFNFNDLYIVYHKDNAMSIVSHFISKYNLSAQQMLCLDKYTRGNLETAYIACKHFNFYDDESVLFLDCDNYYNGEHVLDTLRYIYSIPIDASICTFTPIDHSNKWCFAKSSNNIVTDISEKDNSINGNPMVGVFWFKKLSLFYEASNYVLNNKLSEPYMSDSIKYLLIKNKNIYDIHVDNVIPLGTPEDVEIANLH